MMRKVFNTAACGTVQLRPAAANNLRAWTPLVLSESPQARQRIYEMMRRVRIVDFRRYPYPPCYTRAATGDQAGLNRLCRRRPAIPDRPRDWARRRRLGHQQPGGYRQLLRRGSRIPVTRCGGQGVVAFFGMAKPVRAPQIGPARLRN